MNENSREFIEKMCLLSPRLVDAHKETIDWWKPDVPPVTIAFGDIGQRIVDDLSATDAATNDAIFRLIEEGMTSDDDELGRAVATGLIEAMVGRAAHLGILDQVRTHFGKLSRSHADWWHSK